MPVTRVFRSGNSQAVRIPKEFQFQSDQVEIERRGEEIILREPKKGAADVFDLLASLPKDFMKGGRKQGQPEKRKPF